MTLNDIKLLVIENDNILNMRGGRGYGVGHPYPVKQVKSLLGKSEYAEEEEPPAIEIKKKVKISRAFKKRI